VESGDALNYTTCIMKLTRDKLLHQEVWTDWQELEYLQLNQYDAQGMFGEPILAEEDTAILHLVLTYVIKSLDH
jgi:hypothetical protein